MDLDSYHKDLTKLWKDLNLGLNLTGLLLLWWYKKSEYLLYSQKWQKDENIQIIFSTQWKAQLYNLRTKLPGAMAH